MNEYRLPITSSVVVDLVGPEGPTPVEANLHYDPTDPYAVAVHFLVDGATVRWVFSRELLMSGVHEPVGEGDVRVSPSLDPDGRAALLLTLQSPAGRAVIKMRSRDVLDFLAHTSRAVWPGTESDHVDRDAAVSALVGD
ncbi:MAG: SsgA family sporulation/cell division regulator [Actinomycetota bacterium]